MEDGKKMAAAISVVLHYIQTEEAIVAQQAMAAPGVLGVTAPPERAPSPGVYPPLKLWGMSGRQTQMQIRHLMNMKAFHGLKFR